MPNKEKEISKLIYVDPNYENAHIMSDVNGINKTYTMAPDLEDYCIAVDLEVEVRGRQVAGSTKTSNKIMVMSWNSSKKNDSVSFMQGTTINFNRDEGNKGGFVNSLTTSYTDIFYNDIKDNGTNEMFGISSIDIDYNNYFVPQVTIQFIDIRGVSLFAPEQLSHNNSLNGMSGVSSKDVAGSFFKCFFTFPYPKFRLSVKGFYGQPVSYELTCSDFRATFDSSTGNFGAKATFIGYAFSLLNDITMNILTVAPLSEYLGKNYWDSQLQSRFTVKDAYGNNAPMITLNQFIKVLKNAKNNIARMGNNDPIHKKQVALQSKSDALSAIELSYNDFMGDVLKELEKTKPSFGKSGSKSDIYTLFRLSDNRGFVLLSNDVNDTIEKYVPTSKYDNVNTAIATYNNVSANGLANTFVKPLSGNFTDILVSNVNGKMMLKPDVLKDIFTNDSNIKNNINAVLQANNNKKTIDERVLKPYIYGYVYYDNGLMDKVAKLKTTLQTTIAENQKNVTQFENLALAKNVGFIPNVENVVKIFMAHLETLMYMLYTTASNTGDRTLSSMGVKGSTDVKTEIVPPFPKVTVKSKGVNEKLVDSWIGQYNGNIPERDLINGLLNGVKELQANSLNCPNAVIGENANGGSYGTSMRIPLTPLDFILTSNPFGDDINFKDVSDFAGRLVIRMYETLSLPAFDNDWKDNATLLGKADAINFASLFTNPSNEFVKKLNSSEFNSNFIVDIASNSSKPNIQKEKINKKWAWDGDSQKSYPLIYSMADSGNQLNMYRILSGSDIVNRIIPLQTATFKNSINELKVADNLIGHMPNNMDNYFTIGDKMTKDKHVISNPNLFLLDEDIIKYSEYLKNIVIDGEDMTKVSKYFDCTYNSEGYMENYKINVHTLGKSLSGLYSDIDFSPREGNRLLSALKRDIEEIKKVDVFSYKAMDLMYPTFRGIVDVKERKRPDRFSDVFTDLSSISNYTIPSFAGYENDGKISVSEYNCLFGQYCYYLQNKSSHSQYVKGLMFLDTLNALQFDKSVHTLCDTKRGGATIVPKIAMLLCGAYIWRHNQMILNKNVDVLVSDDVFSFKCKSTERINGTPIPSKLFKLRFEVKTYLMNYFTSWVKTEFATKIQSEFELRTNDGVVSCEFMKEFSFNLARKWYDGATFKEPNFINFEDYLSKTFGDNFMRNYISISRCDTIGNNAYSVKLYNREGTIGVVTATELYITPCVMIKGSKYILSEDSNLLPTIPFGSDKAYIASFLTELKEQYKSINESINNTTNSIGESAIDEDIKISLYKYCKLVYDRWVGGTSYEEWKLEKFFYPHFHFIDAYYNKIGDEALINLNDIVERLINSNIENEYSLLSFMADILAKSSFQLMCIQNFNDLSNKDKMIEMFKPIPYNEMKAPSIHPDFVVMYSYEMSHNLDIEDSEYQNDGLMIDSDDSSYWPDVINGKDMSKGYTIPAFGVGYGSQYQSYFTDINVSMESPMVTEQSLKAQFLIAGDNNPNGSENGKDVMVMGQDLFTIYSNNSYTCTITMMGCAWVQPLMYFCLLNVPMFRGAYLIQKVTHHMEPGNMVTTITGVRMCSTATPLAHRWYYEKINNESGSASTSKAIENTNRLAQVNNDCEYKIFPTVYMSSNGPILDIESLKKVTNLAWLTKLELNKGYNNLYEAIIATMGAEVGDGNSEGELGVKLVAVVMINRLMDNNQDWTKVLTTNQMAVGKKSYGEVSGFANTIKWTHEVLTNGPSSIVGMTTSLPKENKATGMVAVEIINFGVKSGVIAKAHTITLEDVQKIYMYCTTNGYGMRVGDPKKIEAEKYLGYWHNSQFFFQHRGHVFTGHLENTNEPIHWKAVPKKLSGEKGKLSNIALGLFEAIQQTAKSAENINVDINVKVGRTKYNGNEMILTLNEKDKGKMASIFDIVLNGYYNSFSHLYWVVKDTNSLKLDNPISVVVNAKDNNIRTSGNKIVSMVTVDSTYGGYKTVDDFTNLSDLFYRSLSKKYNPLTSQDIINQFKVECKNFTNFDAAKVLLTKNSAIPCPTSDDDSSNYTVIAPTVDSNELNKGLYQKCLNTDITRVARTSVSDFKKLVEDSGGKWNNNLNIIGVRSIDNTNQKVTTNKFIDVCVILYNDGGDWKKHLAAFTTVPGYEVLKNYKQYNKNGAAILKEGYYDAWIIGKHKNDYTALVQRGKDVTTFRDKNGDNIYNFTNPSSGIFGINIHKSGKPESENVNNWSAGCQVFKRVKDFYFMMGMVMKFKQAHYGYTLISESKLPQ